MEYAFISASVQSPQVKLDTFTAVLLGEESRMKSERSTLVLLRVYPLKIMDGVMIMIIMTNESLAVKHH